MLVNIAEWAKAHFKTPPCAATLRVIAKTKQTYPPAIKQGRRWLIDENAKFVGLVSGFSAPPEVPDSAKILIERVLNGGKT